jgi:O-antigen/teichoic acid export membrane protein
MKTNVKQLLQAKLVQSTSLFFAGGILNKAVPFLLMPVLTRYLSAADYGVLGVFQVLVGFASPLMHLNLRGAINRFYFDRDEIDFPRFVGNCIYLITVATVVVSLLLWVLAGPIGRIANYPPEWLWAVVAMGYGTALTMIILGIWQVRQQAGPFITFQFLQTLTNFALSIWLVVGLHQSWQGRITGQVFTLLAFGCLAVLVLDLRRWVSARPSFSYMRRALAFGAPLIPHALGAVTVALINRIFLAHYKGLDAAGIYTVSFQIALVLQLMADSFNRAWVPWFFGKLQEHRASMLRKIVIGTYAYNGVIILLALLAGLVAPWFLSFFVGPEFAPAGKYVLLLAMGFAFDGMYKMVTTYIFYTKRTYLLAFITLPVAVVNIGLNFLLVPRWGLLGAAWATMLSYLLTYLATWLVASRIYSMPWGLGMTATAPPGGRDEP